MIEQMVLIWTSDNERGRFEEEFAEHLGDVVKQWSKSEKGCAAYFVDGAFEILSVSIAPIVWNMDMEHVAFTAEPKFKVVVVVKAKA